MKKTECFLCLPLLTVLFCLSLRTAFAKKTTVTTASQFKTAAAALAPGDTIDVMNGTYDLNTYLNITQSGTPELPIVIRSRNTGGAVLINKSFFDLKQVSYLIIEGFDFRPKDGTVIKMESCNYVRITKNYFRVTETTSQKWIIIGGVYDKPELTSSHNRIDHNFFENKTQPGNFITVDGTPSPAYIPSRYDLIDHNHFKNSSPRVTNEKEAIRLGQSNFSASSGYTVVEFNLFEDCDGDPEFVSVKMCGDTVRYNTFVKCMGTLCLRQGKGSAAYNNFFLGGGKEGTGGIRVYGSDHKIYNNYMENLAGNTWDAAITVTNGDVENTSTSMSSHFRPENLTICYNTIVNCLSPIEIGYANNGSYSKPPRNIAFANNIVTGNKNDFIKTITAPSNWKWIANIMYPVDSARIGISYSDSEIKNTDPKLVRVNGLYKLSINSPAINSAKNDYPFVITDFEGQLRDSLTDIGADEYSSGKILYKPLTSDEVGPLADVNPGAVDGGKSITAEGFSISSNFPNPFNPSTTITYSVRERMKIKLSVYDLLGREAALLVNGEMEAGQHNIIFNVAKYGLSSGVYYCRITAENSSKTIKIILTK